MKEKQEYQKKYIKEYRNGKKNFSVLIDKKKCEDFEALLKYKNASKSDWLNEKIDEELESLD